MLYLVCPNGPVSLTVPKSPCMASMKDETNGCLPLISALLGEKKPFMRNDPHNHACFRNITPFEMKKLVRVLIEAFPDVLFARKEI